MLNEAETRAEHIDPALAAAGWGVVEGSRILREYQITKGRLEGQGRRGKADAADYVLVYRNKKLAVIEAKRWDLAITEGVGQAKKYAKKLAIRFTYSTNGQGIYGIDMDTGNEGDVASYPTPDELWNLTFSQKNEWRDRFSVVPYEDKGGAWGARYYQDIAIESVMEAIAEGRQRILLTLATGTGKTEWSRGPDGFESFHLTIGNLKKGEQSGQAGQARIEADTKLKLIREAEKAKD